MQFLYFQINSLEKLEEAKNSQKEEYEAQLSQLKDAASQKEAKVTSVRKAELSPASSEVFSAPLMLILLHNVGLHAFWSRVCRASCFSSCFNPNSNTSRQVSEVIEHERSAEQRPPNLCFACYVTLRYVDQAVDYDVRDFHSL
jgi:hypothetical protein